MKAPATADTTVPVRKVRSIEYGRGIFYSARVLLRMIELEDAVTLSCRSYGIPVVSTFFKGHG
jgi:hypothetical protein